MPSKIVDVVWNPAKQMDMPLRKRKPGVIGLRNELFNQADNFIDRVLAVAALCPQHQFVILTKQPARAVEYLGGGAPLGGSLCGLNELAPAERRVFSAQVALQDTVLQNIGASPLNRAAQHQGDVGLEEGCGFMPFWPLPNMWMGFSVSNQADMDRMGPDIMRVAALGWKVWISYEPALGPVDFTRIKIGHRRCQTYPDTWNALTGVEDAGHGEFDGIRELYDRPPIQCIVTGGESGPKARPMHPDWPRQTRDPCAEAGVSHFHKQNGEWRAGVNVAARTVVKMHPKTGLPDVAYCKPGPMVIEAGAQYMSRVGKKLAGRELDGKKSKMEALPWYRALALSSQPGVDNSEVG